MPIVTVTPKGQVMIPAPLRKRFGIKPGRKVSIDVEGDCLIIRPLPEDPVDALYGILAREQQEQPAPPPRSQAKRSQRRELTRTDDIEGD